MSLMNKLLRVVLPSLGEEEEARRRAREIADNVQKSSFEPSATYLARVEKIKKFELDPQKASKSAAVIRRLSKEITEKTSDLGYALEGDVWVKKTWRGTAQIGIQRGKYGNRCSVVLSVAGSKIFNPFMNRVLRLGNFCAGEEFKDVDVQDGVFYYDVSEDASALEPHMHIFETRALPWLEAQVSSRRYVDEKDFIPVAEGGCNREVSR